MSGQSQTLQPSTPKHWSQKLRTFDRRWVFLAMGVAIVIPFFAPLGYQTRVSPMVRALFNTVETLEAGDTVFVSLDFDPASTPELAPFFEAVVLHLKRKDIKLVFATTWYAAPPLIERYIRGKIEQPIVTAASNGYSGKPDRAYQNNKDYVWLGFREGKTTVISAFGRDLRATFDNKAADGTALDQIPLMDGKKQLKDFDLLVLISAGSPGVKEYVQLVQGRYNLKMVASCTAVSTTDLTPYYDAGQLLGLAGGMAASAEYEYLVGRPGAGTQGADVLNVGHLVVILAILFGNVIYFADRRWRKRRGR